MANEFLKIISLSAFVFMSFLGPVKSAYPRCDVLKRECDQNTYRYMLCDTICRNLIDAHEAFERLTRTFQYCNQIAKEDKYKPTGHLGCKVDFCNDIIEFAKKRHECLVD